MVPPCLVAGFHTRFVPPPPFSTTLTACSSSDPVECFVHSRPWGSVPAPRCLSPVVRSEDLPTRGSSVWSVPRCFPHVRGGRVVVLEAPGRLRAGQLPKHPSGPRGHRSHSRGSDSGFRPPDLIPCLLRALTTEVVIRPDCRTLQSSSEDGDLRAIAAANRRDLPARPLVGVASPARADRSPGCPGSLPASPGTSPRVCHPEGRRRLEPACAPGRPVSRRPGRLRLASLTPFPRCRSRRAGRVSPGLLATRTQSNCQ
jgi:hypothetical protein